MKGQLFQSTILALPQHERTGRPPASCWKTRGKGKHQGACGQADVYLRSKPKRHAIHHSLLITRPPCQIKPQLHLHFQLPTVFVDHFELSGTAAPLYTKFSRQKILFPALLSPTQISSDLSSEAHENTHISSDHI